MTRVATNQKREARVLSAVRGFVSSTPLESCLFSVRDGISEHGGQRIVLLSAKATHRLAFSKLNLYVRLLDIFIFLGCFAATQLALFFVWF